MRIRLVASLLAAGLLHAGLAAAKGPIPGTAGDRVVMPKNLEGAQLTTRSLGYVAFYELLQGHDPAKAEALLRREFARQVMDREDPAFGQIPWRLGDARVTDRNAAEFVAHSVAPLLLAFGDRLSGEFKTELRPRLAALLAALRNHAPAEDYTNIYLTNAVDRILLGEYLHDADAEREGAAQLDRAIARWRATGIDEFDSPTYYAVDHDALLMVYLHATNAVLRDKARRMLDHLWTDIAANYLPAAGRLTGPRSRDYDPITGLGNIDQWARAYGLGDAPFQASGYHSVFLFDNARDGGYRPPRAALDLATRFPREVVSRWGDDPGQVRWNWVTANGSIGCTSGGYGPQEKLFTVTFAAPPPFAQASVLGDARGNVYAAKDETDGEGKVRRPKTHLMCVQRRELVLANVDLGHANKPGRSGGLSLLLPAQARLAIDGRAVTLEPGASIPVPAEAVVTASAAGAVAGFRIAPGPDAAISMALVSDGREHGVARLAIGLPAKADKRTRLRMVMAAALAPAGGEKALIARLRSAKLETAAHGDGWQTSLADGDGKLEIERSAKKVDELRRLRIDGRDVRVGAPLLVSGQDVVARIWAVDD